jgi:DNA (cytosine-5)-methyltransferase 1
MRDYFAEGKPWERIGNHCYRLHQYGVTGRRVQTRELWPLPNVWLGVTIENRRFVHRADLLRETPAAVRFISAEPLLGPLIAKGRYATNGIWDHWDWEDDYTGPDLDLAGIDWLIVGGESGPNHRRIDPQWVRDLRDACWEVDSGRGDAITYLSGAGKGAGLDGARSGLWSEFARIVRELRPRYVVVENVPDLLAGRGKRWPVAPVSRVLGDLSAIGYDAEWSVLSAAEFGAPHLRERVWIVAYPARDAEAGPEAPAGAERQRAGAGGVGGRAVDPDADQIGRQVLTQLDGEPQPRLEATQCRRHALGFRDPLADPEGVAQRPGLREGRQGAERWRRPSDGGGAGGGIASDSEGDGCRPGGARGSSPGGQGEPESERPFQVADRQGRTLGHADLAPPDALASTSSPRQGAGESGWWATEPDVGRVADGVPSRVDRLAALGNALVPQIAEWIGRRILDYEEGGLA